MRLKFEHVQGYSSVDHFGPEIVSLCELIADERPEPDGIVPNTDHIRSNYKKMVKHGHAIIREAFERYSPSTSYSGPSFNSIKIKVYVESPGSGYLVPPLVGEDNLSVLAEYSGAYAGVSPKDATEWRKRWVKSHPECGMMAR
jgi:hypothetical protein